MAFDALIRQGVATANRLTSSLQSTVTYKPWVGQDGYGAPSYGTVLTLRALVDRTQKPYYTSSGKMISVIATVTLLKPLTANGASGRLEPVDPRDVITLSDGVTAPIVDVSGFEDPKTHLGFLHEIRLGRV